MSERNLQSTVNGSGPRGRLGLVLSIIFHCAVVGGLLLWYQVAGAPMLVAAGPGEGGEGGGGSIEVGVADASALLGFAKPQPLSYIGEENTPINNARVETLKKEPDKADEVLTPPDREKPDKETVKTDRPVFEQHEKPFTGKEERGKSASTSAQVGHSFGSPTPAVAGGIGIGVGGGSGVGTGLPGGSEYGRRIQTILGRNYSPPLLDNPTPQYVIISLRISRDGRILSLVGGRVGGQYFKQRSPLAQINYAAERAILASDPLPPFPPGFLGGASEAVAEVWFKYPK